MYILMGVENFNTRNQNIGSPLNPSGWATGLPGERGRYPVSSGQEYAYNESMAGLGANVGGIRAEYGEKLA